MGGYGSGRRAHAQLTTEYLTIDLARLRKQLNSASSTHAVFNWQSRQAGRLLAIGQLDLLINMAERRIVLSSETEQISLDLVSTTPNYGGRRYWVLAPCCGQRCRCLYLEPGASLPQCRTCLDLNYPSQRRDAELKKAVYDRYEERYQAKLWIQMICELLRCRRQEERRHRRNIRSILRYGTPEALEEYLAWHAGRKQQEKETGIPTIEQLKAMKEEREEALKELRPAA